MSHPSKPESLTLYLTNDDPTNMTLYTLEGHKLYKVSSSIRHTISPPTTAQLVPSPQTASTVFDANGSYVKSHITRVSRLYGSSARAARQAVIAATPEGTRRRAASNASTGGGCTGSGDPINIDGLMVAEMEWMEKTRSSRIRFGVAPSGSQKLSSPATSPQSDTAGSYAAPVIDVRVDEFLKSTNGRSFSRMFATSDGKIYKWRTEPRPTHPSYATVPDSSSHLSVPTLQLVELHPSRHSSGPPLVTFRHGDESMNRPSSLHVSTSVLSIIDQIVVSWVIMERERRCIMAASKSA
ncbi:hypothetical protein CPB86DRAFT_147247 [Serendipita vermifera]|nr:hypothetical protein CPB86DRAFT_147247 [Serendipita vermifera]